MSLARQTSYSALSAIASAGSRFLVSAILAHAASKSTFGQYSYIQWLVDIIFLVGSLGLNGAASRYLAEYREGTPERIEFMRLWKRFLFLQPLLAGCVMAIYLWFDINGNIYLLGASGLWVFANSAGSLINAALVGLQRFKNIFIVNVVYGLTAIIGVSFIKYRGNLSVEMICFASAAAALNSACVGLLFLIKDLRLPNSGGVGRVKGLKNYAVNTWLTSIVSALLWSRGEFPVVRSLAGDEGVAAYAAVLIVYSGAVQFITLGLAAVAPKLTRMWGDGDISGINLLAKRIMLYQMTVSGLVAICMIFFGREIMWIFFGEKYNIDSFALGIVSLGLISFSVFNYNHILQIKTNGSFSRISTILGAIYLYISAYFLMLLFGILGAAVARASSLLFIGLYTIFVYRKNFGTGSVDSHKFFGVIFSMLLAMCLMLAMRDSPLQFRIVVAIVFAIIYCLYILGRSFFINKISYGKK